MLDDERMPTLSLNAWMEAVLWCTSRRFRILGLAQGDIINLDQLSTGIMAILGSVLGFLDSGVVFYERVSNNDTGYRVPNQLKFTEEQCKAHLISCG